VSCPVSNTLDLPCRAAQVLTVRDPEAWREARDRALPGPCLLPLGAGSNVVLPETLDAIVLRAGDDAIEVLKDDHAQVTLRVGAALDWHTFVERCLEAGWYGLENLALIPGTVGAAPVQNIGAYGRELEEFVSEVQGIDLVTGDKRGLDRRACAFGYRTSIFKGPLRQRFLITHVHFTLAKRPALVLDYPTLRAELATGTHEETPAGVFSAVCDLRRRRLPDPGQHPNVGSFFKNPVLDPARADILARAVPEAPMHRQADGSWKLSAAWLIDACGLRGEVQGGARVSPRHALVLENAGGARYRDILELAARVRDRVRARYGVVLEPEPRLYRADGREAPLP